MSDSEFDNRSLASDVTRFTSRSYPRSEENAEKSVDEEYLSDDPQSESLSEEIPSIPPEESLVEQPPQKILEKENEPTPTTNVPEESLSDDDFIIEREQGQVTATPNLSESESLSDDISNENNKNGEEKREEERIPSELFSSDVQGEILLSEDDVSKVLEQSKKDQTVQPSAEESSGDETMRMPVDQEEILKENLEQSMISEKWKDSFVKSILQTKKRVLLLQNYWGLLVPSNKVELSMSNLCFTFTNSIYNAKRNSLTLKFTDPKALITLFENGDLFISGCKSKKSMIRSTKLILQALEKYANIKTLDYREPMCMNIVASMSLDLTKIDSNLLNDSKTMLDFASLKNRLSLITTLEKLDESSDSEIQVPLFTFSYEKPNKVIGFSFNVYEQENSFVKFGVLLISASGYISMYVQFPNYRVCFADTVEKVYLFVANRLINALENGETKAIENAKLSIDEKDPIKAFNLDEKGNMISLF